jgi:hypothetical protein
MKYLLEAKIHKEITEYEGKIFFGMSGKQIICVMVSLVIVIPLFFLLQESLGIEITGYICILVALPIMAFGFFKYKGRSFTDIIKLMRNYYFTNQKKCCVNIVNTDYIIQNEVNNDKRKKSNKRARAECTECQYRYTAGDRKQLRKKRKAIRNDLTAFKKEFILQQKAK